MGNRDSSMLQDEEIKSISEETGFTDAQIERLYSRLKLLDTSGICGSLSRQDFLRIPELAINPLCERIVHMFFVGCDDDHERINFRQFMRVLATFNSSAKPTKPRQVSRQECVETVWTSLSSCNRHKHMRRSSCDGFLNYYPVQHHTTNQHNIHYVASATHLVDPLGAINSNNNNLMCNSDNHHNNLFKKPYPISAPIRSLVDSDEPADSRKKKLLFMFKIYDIDNDNRISPSDLKEILKMMTGSYIDEVKLDHLVDTTIRQTDKNHSGYIEFEEFCTAFLHRDIDEALRIRFSDRSTRGYKVTPIHNAPPTTEIPRTMTTKTTATAATTTGSAFMASR